MPVVTQSAVSADLSQRVQIPGLLKTLAAERFLYAAGVLRAELLVDAESLTEGSRGLVAVPSVQAATRESFKRACLLGWQVDTVCYGQRALVAGTGAGLPGAGQCQLAHGVQDLGLTLDNAQVLKQGKSPLKQGASSDEVSACSRERAHAVQYIGLAHAVSKLAIEVQGALLARGSCCVIPISLLCAAEPVQSISLAEAIAEFAVQCERLLLIGRCRCVLAEESCTAPRKLSALASP